MCSTQEFVKAVNKIRLSNKNKWYHFSGEVNGKQVRLKAFATWVQRIEVVDQKGKMVKDGNCCDCSVMDFKLFLAKVVSL